MSSGCVGDNYNLVRRSRRQQTSSRSWIHTSARARALRGRGRELMASCNVVVCSSLLSLCFGIGTNYWYATEKEHVGLWEWYLHESVSIFSWLVLSNKDFLQLILKLLFVAVILNTVALILIALVLANKAYYRVTFLMSAGMCLLISGLCSAAAVAIYATGLNLLSMARIIYKDCYGYSFFSTVLGAVLTLVACLMVFTAVCVITDEFDHH